MPIEALGSQGLWLGHGMLLQGTGAPGRGKGCEYAGHGATPGEGLKSKINTNKIYKIKKSNQITPVSLQEQRQAAHQPSSLSPTTLPASPSSFPYSWAEK